MKQRRWNLDEKMGIVLEGLKEKRSVAEICRECAMLPLVDTKVVER